eukprot:1159500-Pelagomonas_calceolata.AAC.14
MRACTHGFADALPQTRFGRPVQDRVCPEKSALPVLRLSLACLAEIPQQHESSTSRQGLHNIARWYTVSQFYPTTRSMKHWCDIHQPITSSPTRWSLSQVAKALMRAVVV